MKRIDKIKELAKQMKKLKLKETEFSDIFQKAFVKGTDKLKYLDVCAEYINKEPNAQERHRLAESKKLCLDEANHSSDICTSSTKGIDLPDELPEEVKRVLAEQISKNPDAKLVVAKIDGAQVDPETLKKMQGMSNSMVDSIILDTIKIIEVVSDGCGKNTKHNVKTISDQAKVGLGKTERILSILKKHVTGSYW